MSLAEILRRELASIIPLSAGQLEALTSHYELLLRWNRSLNLTTVTELPDAAIRHYCESLFLTARISEGKVIDVGSGAGFPGIPVAIGRPECSVTLVESHQRKAVFLREATRNLGNVRVLSVRAETITEQYDWMVSRAVDAAQLLNLRLAVHYAFLMGSDDALKIAARDQEATVFPLPWGDRRVLLLASSRISNPPCPPAIH